MTARVALRFTIVGVVAGACTNPYESRLNQKCFYDEDCQDPALYCDRRDGEPDGLCREVGDSTSLSNSGGTTGTTDTSGTPTGTSSPTSSQPTISPTDASTSESEASTAGLDDDSSGGSESSGGTNACTGAPAPAEVSYGDPLFADFGSTVDSVDVADIDGDGDLDIGFMGEVSSTFATLHGDGAGGFTTVVEDSLGQGAEPTEIRLAAIADGDVDVVFIGESRVARMRGDGTGGFQPYEQQGNDTVSRFVLGDFTGDDVLDVAAISGNGSLIVKPGNATTEAFGGSLVSAIPTDSPQRLAAGDLNDDGDLDVVVADYVEETLTVMLGGGAGLLNAGDSLVLTGRPLEIAVADFDCDAFPDVAAAFGAPGSGLNAFAGDGDGGLSTMPGSIAALGDPEALVLVDLDGDLDADALVAVDDLLYIFLSNGDGTFDEPTFTSCNETILDLAVGELNGDDVLDVAATTTDQPCIFLSDAP